MQPEMLMPPEAPLMLKMPEPVRPVKEPDAAAAIVPISDQTRTATLNQADQFIADLLQMDVTSGDFRARIDSAFRLGRKEISESALLTGKFMDKNFAGDTNNPAFQVMNEMRALFEALDPVVRRRQDRLLNGFSPEEVEAAFTLIRRLSANLKA